MLNDPTLPILNQANRKLASDNQRVMRFILSLPEHVDDLVAAAQLNDWNEVRRLGDFLAESSDTYGLRHLGETSRQLCDACETGNRIERKRRLVRVIGAAGRAAKPPPG